jgi:hypothetical protein
MRMKMRMRLKARWLYACGGGSDRAEVTRSPQPFPSVEAKNRHAFNVVLHLDFTSH